MRLLKSHPLLGLFNSYLVDSPQPSNISYIWNFGSLLGMCLVIQIITGIFLAMHYTPNIDLAFTSVEHIFMFPSCVHVCNAYRRKGFDVFFKSWSMLEVHYCTYYLF